VIGDEYVLVKKRKEKEEKDLKDEKKGCSVYGLNNSYSSFGGRFGECKAVLTYDFSFEPSTSSTFQVGIALAPAQDTSFTNYWRALFSEMKMDKADVQLDFSQFMSSVGHDTALSPCVWAYNATTIASTMYYADVSDWKSAKFIGWSQAKPVVKYTIPSKWLKCGWTDGQIASNVHPMYGRWMSTGVTASTFHNGVIHIASQKAFFDTTRTVVGRLKMWMTFRGQL